MATTSIWKVKGRVDKVIRYAENPEKTSFESPDRDFPGGLEDAIGYAAQPSKTDGRRLVSGLGCLPETAAEEMRATKRQYGKTGGIVAFHGYQSFAPGETDPQTAHEMGVALAAELWADRFEVVVATHVDREHLHNHFVINSVSYADGRRFHRDASCYRRMREASDRLCAERGLSVIEGGAPGAARHYSEWADERAGKPTWRSLVKADVDDAVAHAATERQFWANLAALGYEVKRGKDISVRPPGKERFVRLARNFGADYTAEGISRRILENRRPQLPHRRGRGGGATRKRAPAPRGSLMAAYRRWLYLLGAYRASGERVHFLVREDVRHMERIGQELALLSREGIETEAQLEDYAAEAGNAIRKLAGERGALRKAALREGVPADEARLEAIARELKRLKKEVRMCASIEERSKSLPDRIAAVEADAEEREEGGRDGSGIAGGRAGREDDPRGRGGAGEADRSRG